jgi:hypothetical protein
MQSLRFVAATCTVFLLCSSAVAFATPEHPVDQFPTTFSEPRVDVLADGKVVINFDTQGEFKGMLTFNLTPDGAGVLTGDWVLAVRYIDNTDPATGVEPPTHDHESAAQHEIGSAQGDADHPHRDYVRYINQGAIGGTIDAASIDIADGKLADFRAQLTITNGTLNFDGVTGTGLAEMSRGLALAVNGGRR